MPVPTAVNRSTSLRTSRSAVRLAALIAAPLLFAAVMTASAQDATPANPEPHTHHALSQKSFTPASVFAKPDLACKIYPAGDPAKPVTVYTDSDGYARFYAVRAIAGDKIRELALDCKDAAGKASTYPVDLTSEETFAPRPLDLEKEPGTDRPALSGDPLAYSDAELIQAGYGLRPDPVKSPDAYQRWLTAAILPGRMLAGKHSGPRNQPTPKRIVRSELGPFWTGTTIGGRPNYLSVEGNLSVPGVIPNGDETQMDDVHVAVWNGLDSPSGGGGLIQGGYQIDINKSVVNYFTFREYCCGDADSNGYSGDFNPRVGDTIYDVEWYCDKNGNININGGYGCSHIHDLNTGAVLDCTKANSSSCWSVKANTTCTANPAAKNCWVLGGEADAVIELQGPAWPDLQNTVTITGSAYSSKSGSYSQTVTNDPVLTMLKDFTGVNFGGSIGLVPESPSHMNVSIGNSNQTYFNVSQFAQVGGLSHSGALNQVIAVGPNGSGSTLGDPWVLGSRANSNGDYGIYHWVNGTWNQMPGAGTQIAIGQDGHPWLVNHAGVVFFWTASAWNVAYGNACASHIAVAPGGTLGTPWILGCHEQATGYNIYKMQGGVWEQQTGQATAIAIGPYGPWIIVKSGAVYYWDVNHYALAPGNPCATAIAANSHLSGYGNDDVWILGCHYQSTGYDIYQLQGASTWANIPGNATQISISPDLGIPWVVNNNGNIFE